MAGLLACGLLLAAATTAAKEPLEGTWRGQWVRDGSALEVTLRFSKSERLWEGSFDSEALRVTGIPLQKILWNPPEVRWEVVGDVTTTTFVGQLRGDALSGQLKERDAAGTFSLARTEAPPPSQREEIAFASGDARLAGTVFVPAGKGPHPGIVFLHGSGAEGRWASSYLAERFARAGFAALTFDKRGVGQSGGDWRTAGFEELAADAAAAVAALAARPYVAPGRVGIHGHSQGGSIAPLAAARIGDPAFVIASAATGVPMDEMEIFSLENALGVGAMSSSDAAAARELVAAIVATAYHGRPRERLIEVWQKVREKPWAFEPPPETDSYWSFSKRTAAYDALALWRQVSAPTLLVFGEADERVPARTSAARIAEAYLGGKGTSMKAVFFAGADHTFRLRSAPEGAFAWPRTAPGYPDVLIEWALEAVSNLDEPAK
jgi:alpha-beta hydrolase superfamily lysophospholipase